MNNIIIQKGGINLFRSVLFPIILILFLPSLIFSQTPGSHNVKAPDPRLHHEVKDDDYRPVLRKTLGRSPAYRYSMDNIITVQVNVDSNGQNILGDAANEPSIAVDRNNPDRMAIGWRQFNTVIDNFRQAGYGYTTDGGETWTFPGVIEPGIFRSDPVLDADIDGNFYYNSLGIDPTYNCYVFKSSTGGSSWDDGVFAQGGDKQWMTIDKSNSPGTGNIYAYWTYAYSVCDPDFFTRSTDNGESFENCTSIPGYPYWGTLAVNKESWLYAGGTTDTAFLVATSLSAQDSSQIVGWDTTIAVYLDGLITYGIDPNPGGLGGQTQIGVDTSGGPYDGSVYLLCSVARFSNSDPSDVMFARSTDGGLTWEAPARVNDDAGTSAYQWFGTMSVAPDGRIDVVWLDTRDNPGTNISALYYSYSIDGGVTWSSNERMSEFFDPHLGWPNQNKMGDYFDMVSDSAGARLAWAATFNGEQDIYYSRISRIYGPVEVAEAETSPAEFSLLQNYPNPFNPVTAIGYTLPVNSYVTLKIYDILGNEVAVLVNKQKPAGEYKVDFNASELVSGVYFYVLKAGNFIQSRKMVLLK